MNSYRATLRYLYGLQYRGMKFGLRNTKVLLKALGNPERQFPSIHIAGTNGKGSTASFLASILAEAGYSTGLYTSPHLVRFTERIRIGGEEIPEARLVAYTRVLKPYIEEVRATFFEATTCIAFRYFADEHVDVAVVETGLGGRLDATNVLTPIVSVITSVALDHTAILGTTIRAIAREKGGIIKPGIPCVVGRADRDAVHVLRTIARKKSTHLTLSETRVQLSVHEDSRTRIDARGKTLRVRRALLGLEGDHQTWNARTALSAIDVVNGLPALQRPLRRIASTSVARGLANVVLNTGLRARFETFGKRERYIMDVAHNPDAIRTLVRGLRRRELSGLIVVFGVMRDKDCRTMIRELSPVTACMVPVVAAGKRALRLRELTRIARKEGIWIAGGGTVAHGIAKARRLSMKGAPILVTGSHYVVGEAMTALERQGSK